LRFFFLASDAADLHGCSHLHHDCSRLYLLELYSIAFGGINEPAGHEARALQISMCQRAYRILVEEVGFNPQDIIFDPNILTVGTGLAEHNNYAVDFFRATRELKRICPGCKVSGGVSNIAFSFRGNEPVRRAFHSAFLHWGSKMGMDMGIVNAAQVCLSLLMKERIFHWCNPYHMLHIYMQCGTRGDDWSHHAGCIHVVGINFELPTLLMYLVSPQEPQNVSSGFHCVALS
jgi:hypothetical protein